MQKAEDTYFRYDDQVFGSAMFGFDAQILDHKKIIVFIEPTLVPIIYKLKWYQVLLLFIKDWFTSGPIYDT